MKVSFIDLAAQYKSLKPEIDEARITVLNNENFIGGEAVKHKEEDFPVSVSLQKSVLSLPIYPELTEGQINYVSDLIRSFYGGN